MIISSNSNLEFLLINMAVWDYLLLGCEFLGRVLHPRMEITLQKLKLDHNEFGTEGLKQLAAGLCMNSVLEKLSLNYCAITAEGSKYI